MKVSLIALAVGWVCVVQDVSGSLFDCTSPLHVDCDNPGIWVCVVQDVSGVEAVSGVEIAVCKGADVMQ